MEKIKPKKIVGDTITGLYVIRMYNVDDMQEFLCTDGEDLYLSQQERKRERLRQLNLAFENRLKVDSEEQLKYNNLMNSISNYKDIEEYKHKTSFKYRILKFLKLNRYASS